jgi:hypothetical protein
MMLISAIKKTYKDEKFWSILLDESTAQSGPFDGGCLICARALILACPSAELVRITSPCNGGQTEHYGVRLEGLIYDFDGLASSHTEWIDRFKKVELVNDRELGFATGYDPDTPTPDDVRASEQISQLIVNYMKNDLSNLQGIDAVDFDTGVGQEQHPSMDM